MADDSGYKVLPAPDADAGYRVLSDTGYKVVAPPAAAAPAAIQPSAVTGDRALDAMIHDAERTANSGRAMALRGLKTMVGAQPAENHAVDSMLQPIVNVGEGALEAVGGTMNWLTSPIAPLFTQTQDENRRNVGEPVTRMTGSQFLGDAAANMVTGAEGLALGPEMLVRPKPIAHLPIEPGIANRVPRALYGTEIPRRDLGAMPPDDDPPAGSAAFAAPHAAGAPTHTPGLVRPLTDRPLGEVAAPHAETPRAAEPATPPRVTQEDKPNAAAAEPAAATTFRTSRGSTYQVHEDGTTTRNKAYRAEHGADQQGPQPRSHSTFYVSNDDADVLGLFQTKGPRKALVRLPDGRWGVKYLDGKDAGKIERRSVVSVQTKPAAGLTPVEVWNDGTRVHFGNPITDVQQAAPPKPPGTALVPANTPRISAGDAATGGGGREPPPPGGRGVGSPTPSPRGGGPDLPHTPSSARIPTLREGISHIAKTIERIFSPTTVDSHSRLAEAHIRARTGEGLRDTEQARALLEPAYSLVRKMDLNQRFNFLSYMENRSRKTRVGDVEITPVLPDRALQPLADSLRRTFGDIRNTLSGMAHTAKMSFIEDYFPHFWKDPEAARAFSRNWLSGGSEGTGGFTRQREVPTIADGIAAGLEPVTYDPIEAAMLYVENAQRFIATNRVFEEAEAQGTVRYLDRGTQPEGWVPIKSRLGDKPGVPLKVAYAPEGWARVYNNFTPKGFQDAGGDLFRMAQQTSNWMTAFELGLSGYHALTMAQESMVNSMARAIEGLRRGDVFETGRALGNVPLSWVTDSIRGHQLQQVYLGKMQGTRHMQRVADLLTQAGGRAVKMERTYLASQGGSYVKAFKRGTLSEEFRNDLRGMYERPVVGSLQAATRHIARVMDTVMSPMFEHYIPKLKTGAFYENMSQWLRQHPNATADESAVAAREIWDSTDNRFGEMVQDNIFWDKSLKQSMHLALRSYTWTFGSLREIAGGMWDTAKAPFNGKWTPRMSYVIALPVTYGILASVYQYLKTGTPPQNTHDLMAPRTGGVDEATGEPERLVMPGYMKDVFGWYYHGALGELENKIATGPRLAGELLTNQDWRNLPIAPGNQVDDPTAPGWLQAYFNHVLESVGPISIRQQVEGKPIGSNISGIESMLGVHSTGRMLTDPEGYRELQEYLQTKDWIKKQGADERQQEQRQH